ncbi:uncharacterized protein LOC119067557 [Bradysia coprophila]|uniref:uncharacterized protein LOC119067557 n=1 Tax=Bradysia coprophila TaxID=38358 RepID=UPI00187D7474|nr:uncharacterized protein LOC119067557 [Bradysia coprophila]
MDRQQFNGLENQENNRNQPNSTSSTLTTSLAIRTHPHAISKTTSSDRVYAMAEYYKQRKELQLKKIKEEEERLRRHKARPMPNFKAIHSKALTTAKECAETCISPETPEVLRRGLAMKEKQQQKMKEYDAKMAERPPIVARSTKVLTEEPFKPKLEPHPELKVVPFKLGMEKRLMERKEYDANYQRQLAEKREKEEERKREQDNVTRQQVRQATTFKARPNPFKKAS